MDHADLVAEMHTIENLPTQDRLHLARMRRAQQLKVARQKEKEWQKMQHRREKSLSHHYQQHSKKPSRHISFENSVVLLEAAGRNDIDEVEHLLQKGMTPDASNEDGLTALHQCCIDNNIEMLKLLLDYGANVDAQDSDKWTPLHAAATCGHLNLVKILINRGANLLAVNTDGNMPYDLCDDEETLDYIEAEMSKRGVTQELIDETRAQTERQMLTDLMGVANNGGDLEQPDHQGATPLHIAAANGYSSVVEFLLEHHVNVDSVDKDLWSPVHAAACWGHLEVLEMLAQYGANLDAKNKDDETPSDICEDSEIRERIEQLRSEQESKRLAEAQRRRVRRSQSNNTRAQSVRRTSLRDKTLTTKKDAVEETRLRLQAQEVFIAPESAAEPKSIADSELSSITSTSSANQKNSDQLPLVPKNNSRNRNRSTATSQQNVSSTGQQQQQQQQQHHQHHHHQQHRISSSSALSDMKLNNNTNGNITINSSSQQNNHHNNNISNSLANHNNNSSSTPSNLNGIGVHHNNNNSSSSSSHVNGGGAIQNSFYNYNSNSVPYHHNNQQSRLVESTSSTALTTTGNTLNSRRPPEGKDCEEFTLSRDSKMLVGHNSLGNLHKLSSHQDSSSSTEIFSTTKENGKINVQVTVLVDNALSGTTLSNLKKQRSLSRSNAITENGSVITATAAAAASTTSHHHGSISANSISGQSIELSVLPATSATVATVGSEITQLNSIHQQQQQQQQNHHQQQQQQQQPSMTKFCGVTSDVVSDSTRSKRCCMLM